MRGSRPAVGTLRAHRTWSERQRTGQKLTDYQTQVPLAPDSATLSGSFATAPAVVYGSPSNTGVGRHPKAQHSSHDLSPRPSQKATQWWEEGTPTWQNGPAVCLN